MPSLRELKKHRRSIAVTEQLAGAMRTVSAAKLSQVSAALEGYRPYADSCATMLSRFGGAVSEAMPCIAPEAPVCYVIFSSNRGLCGGYNITLLEYADSVLKSEERPYRLIVCGKAAASYLAERDLTGCIDCDTSHILSDVPTADSCLELCDLLCGMYKSGEVSAVYLIYQSFVNMLTQEPTVRRLLPLTVEEDVNSERERDVLFVPDRETVIAGFCTCLVNATFYSTALEAASGAQAATLMAMRSAYDNARETSAELDTEIGRKRQSEVTAGVLETASDNNSMSGTAET